MAFLVRVVCWTSYYLAKRREAAEEALRRTQGRSEELSKEHSVGRLWPRRSAILGIARVLRAHPASVSSPEA